MLESSSLTSALQPLLLAGRVKMGEKILGIMLPIKSPKRKEEEKKKRILM